MVSSEEACGQVDITPFLIYKEPCCRCILGKVLWTLRMRKLLSHMWAGLSSSSSLSWDIYPQGTKSSCTAPSPFSSCLMYISNSTRDDSKHGYLMWRVKSLEKTLILGKIEGRSKRGQQRMRWLDGIPDSTGMSLSSSGRWQRTRKPGPWGPKDSDTTEWLNGMTMPYQVLLRLHLTHTIACLCAKPLQSCLTLRNPMDCSSPTVHGILQERIQDWDAFSFSRGSFQPRDWTWVCCSAGIFFTIWATRKPQSERGWPQFETDMCTHVHSVHTMRFFWWGHTTNIRWPK